MVNMKNEITVYELLGLIKDNKAPKKIKYENIIWKYNIKENEYIKEINENYWLFQDYFPNNLNFMDCLNDKVEIIEDKKEELEELDMFDDLQDILNKADNGVVLNAIHKCLTSEKYKINEIIRHLKDNGNK